MQIFKKGVKIAAFFALGVFLLFIVNEAYLASSYVKLMFHELYHQEKNIDLFFCGASHTYRSFVPSIFDEELEINSFNLGTSNQTYEGGYFLLKEALKKNRPSTVVMEITYSNLEYVDGETKLSDYILLDNMRNGANKCNYVKSAMETEELAEVMFPCYRNRSTKTPLEAIKNLKDKWENGYFKNLPIKVFRDGKILEEYQEKGFVYSYDSFEERELVVEPYPWKKETIHEQKIFWLKKTTALCKEKGIDIIWVTAPIPEVSIIKLENYEEIHLFIEQLAQETGVEYYDFNYCKREYLPRNDKIYYYDSSHMNGKYALLFSDGVARILKERKMENFDKENYFYNSYDEWKEGVLPCNSEI
ncbi:hypothetical protein [Acetivibrio ethanolgignens]|uniref:Uncharacterized protein n=1 Tax=Acetivibrio ethanolgignens TaxID=290052 RepID=A0A0V8QE03_9FIRM|nr:hypothetical protein [Acetivibrio ethanolgignens]KSV58821.1 hypothetical protein ASU35_11600 [Acetivibrio ethanolgignens]